MKFIFSRIKSLKLNSKKWEKLNLKMEKLNFPGTDWRGLALIGAQKNPES